jgi:histone H3/H4
MIVQMQEFMNEQTQALAHQAQKFRKNPVGFMRKALVDSAEGLKSLKSPVRKMAHSGVKFTVVSQHALQSLIEFESEVITSALSGAAARFEHAARAEDIVDLVRDQADMLPATRDRLVDEATRGAAIFKDAGREVRKLAMETYGKVFETAGNELPKAKTTRARKAKRVVRKTTARARRLAA